MSRTPMDTARKKNLHPLHLSLHLIYINKSNAHYDSHQTKKKQINPGRSVLLLVSRSVPTYPFINMSERKKERKYESRKNKNPECKRR